MRKKHIYYYMYVERYYGEGLWKLHICMCKYCYKRFLILNLDNVCAKRRLLDALFCFQLFLIVTFLLIIFFIAPIVLPKVLL